MRKPHSRCRKGLHDLTLPGAVRVEVFTCRDGMVFTARRCKQCQHDRYRRHNSHRPIRRRTSVQL